MHFPNGGGLEKSLNVLSNNYAFPQGGVPSLHLPVVVVLSPCLLKLFMS